MSTLTIVDEYIQLINEAVSAKGSRRSFYMKKAYYVLEKMDYLSHTDLIKQIRTFDLKQINLMLGAGMKEPTRTALMSRAAQLEGQKFQGY